MRLSLNIIARLLAALAGVASASAPASAATVNASVSAGAIKPLVLTKQQDLNLGTVTLGPGTWDHATVSLSRSGVFSCESANLICTGATTVAQYNVQGSNQNTVHISAPNVTLTNEFDPTQTLTLITDAVPSVVLPNSGFPGINFTIGGSVTLDSTTAAGTYVGTFNVTVDY